MSIPWPMSRDQLADKHVFPAILEEFSHDPSYYDNRPEFHLELLLMIQRLERAWQYQLSGEEERARYHLLVVLCLGVQLLVQNGVVNHEGVQGPKGGVQRDTEGSVQKSRRTQFFRPREDGPRPSP